MPRKFTYISMQHLANFNQELRTQTKSYLTKYIYNKYSGSDELRTILKRIISAIWVAIRQKYGTKVWNIVRFYLKGGTAIIETLEYYINVTGDDQLRSYLQNIIRLDLFKGKQSDWDTTMYINPALDKNKFYQVQAELAEIVLKVYSDFVTPLSEFFSREKKNLKKVLPQKEFVKNIIEPTVETMMNEINAAAALGKNDEKEELEKKLASFQKSVVKFVHYIQDIKYELTSNTSYMVQPDTNKLGPAYTYLTDVYERTYAEHLVTIWRKLFGCTQELPWMKQFVKYVTSKYGPVLLSINRSIMNKRGTGLQHNSAHHFDLFRFMLCYSGRISWKRASDLEDTVGFTFPFYFFDYQAELVDISTLNYHSHENNETHWNAASYTNMMPFSGVNVRSWEKAPKIDFPVSNFMYAMHDLIFTLRDKEKLTKRCQRLFILFNIICAMNRQIDLEEEFHFKSILSSVWTEKEILECQKALKDIKYEKERDGKTIKRDNRGDPIPLIYSNSDIAMRTLLATPSLSSKTCSAIFPQLKTPDCIIKGHKYPSDELVEYIYQYVEGVISKRELSMIPAQNLCTIMQMINREISDYAMQQKVSVDVFTKLRQYNLQNISLGDWKRISTNYIMFPYLQRAYQKWVNRFTWDVYNIAFKSIFLNINDIMPNNSDKYKGPVVDRSCMTFKNLGSDIGIFEGFVRTNKIEYDGFYKYGVELDLWELSSSVYIDNLTSAYNTAAAREMGNINKQAKGAGDMVMMDPSTEEEYIKANWQFLTPGTFEKIYTITSIGNGTVISKNTGSKVTTVVSSIYIKQRYWSKGRSHILPHIVPVLRVNIMRRTAGYTIPAVVSNNSYNRVRLLYYQSYLETIKINVRKKLDNFPKNTNPLIISSTIYTLVRFLCGYYGFMQARSRLARSLSITTNEGTVVDVCKYAKNVDNFTDAGKSTDFYVKLDKEIATDATTSEKLDMGRIPSVFRKHDRGLVNREEIKEIGDDADLAPRVRRRKIAPAPKPPEDTMEDEQREWFQRQQRREELVKKTAKRRKGDRRFLYEKCTKSHQCHSGCCAYNKEWLDEFVDRQIQIFKRQHPSVTREQIMEFKIVAEKEANFQQCSPPEYCGSGNE